MRVARSARTKSRHVELVSATTLHSAIETSGDRWALKQVRGDEDVPTHPGENLA